MGGILAVYEDDVRTVFGLQSGEHVLEGLAAYRTHDIADK
jgi:hypothetical protein